MKSISCSPIIPLPLLMLLPYFHQLQPIPSTTRCGGICRITKKLHRDLPTNRSIAVWCKVLYFAVAETASLLQTFQSHLQVADLILESLSFSRLNCWVWPVCIFVVFLALFKYTIWHTFKTKLNLLYTYCKLLY